MVCPLGSARWYATPKFHFRNGQKMHLSKAWNEFITGCDEVFRSKWNSSVNTLVLGILLMNFAFLPQIWKLWHFIWQLGAAIPITWGQWPGEIQQEISAGRYVQDKVGQSRGEQAGPEAGERIISSALLLLLPFNTSIQPNFSTLVVH